MARTQHVDCSTCSGTGKVALCHYCKGKPDDRNIADGSCDECGKPFCWIEHGGISGEDCEYCANCKSKLQPV